MIRPALSAWAARLPRDRRRCPGPLRSSACSSSWAGPKSEAHMDYRRLGRSDVKVSAIGLGTMTFGEQNTEADGHAQIDYALDRGITMFDAAEVYPVPPKPETRG